MATLQIGNFAMHLNHRVDDYDYVDHVCYNVYYQLNFFNGKHQLFNPQAIQHWRSNETGFEFTNLCEKCTFSLFLEDFLNDKPGYLASSDTSCIMFNFICKNTTDTTTLLNKERDAVNLFIEHPWNNSFNYWLQIEISGKNFKQKKESGYDEGNVSIQVYLPVDKDMIRSFYTELQKEWEDAESWMQHFRSLKEG